MTLTRMTIGLLGLMTALTATSGMFAQQVKQFNSGSGGASAPLNELIDQPSGTGAPPSLRYAIQCQDTLTLSFPFSPELNETVTVQPDGFISLLSAKSLYVQGLTVPDLIGHLKKAYSDILKSPEMTVDLKDFQRPYFTVIGEVNKAGKYELRERLTVAQALSLAGGIEPSAKTQVFLLHRNSDAGYRVEKLNIRDVLNGKKTSQDQLVKTGDMIYVPEKFIVRFKEYVPYSFNLGTYFQLANVP